MSPEVLAFLGRLLLLLIGSAVYLFYGWTVRGSRPWLRAFFWIYLTVAWIEACSLAFERGGMPDYLDPGWRTGLEPPRAPANPLIQLLYFAFYPFHAFPLTFALIVALVEG